MNKSSLAVLSLFSFLLIFSTISVAQLGEVAGQPHFNVSLGGTETLTVILVNQANYPLPVKVMLPQLSTKNANAITPIVTASPMEGNVPANGELQINVTVYIPQGTNKPGYTWTGVMQMVTIPGNASTTGGGATIFEGVAKIITITATEHVVTIWDYAWLMALIVIIVVVAVIVLFARSRGKLGGKRVKATAVSKSARAKSTKKARARKKATRRSKKAGSRTRRKATRARRSTRRRRR